MTSAPLFPTLPPDLVALMADVLVPMLVVVVLKTSEVLLQTFRTVFVVSGRRLPAGMIALVEASVIITALSLVLTDLSPPRIAGFILGMGLGTVVGMEAVYRLRLGMVTVRAFVPPAHAARSADAIRALGHGATVFLGEGRDGEVAMVLSSVRRRDARRVVTAIEAVHRPAFTTVDNLPAPGSAIGGILGARV
ncbi:DUF5698 domain-containing protein [Euzebya sp.]|uniref:DUF5698 domain-containing protein n=1 Tax=Euzebya sp. TaxID=1971409 RepID=UPI003516A568